MKQTHFPFGNGQGFLGLTTGARGSQGNKLGLEGYRSNTHKFSLFIKHKL